MILSFFFCFLPLFLTEIVLLFIYKKQIAIKLQFAVLLGFICIFPTSLLQNLFLQIDFINSLNQSLIGLLFYSILINGFTEEFFKGLFISIFSQKEKMNPYFVPLAFSLGISFACFENIGYFFAGFADFSAIFMRIFSTVLLHSFSASLIATGIKQEFLAQKILCFLQAVILHALYNFFSIQLMPLKIFAYICVLAMIFSCFCKWSNKKLQN